MVLFFEAVSTVGGMCWFGVCWGHFSDVSRTGMFTVGFGNSIHDVSCAMSEVWIGGRRDTDSVSDWGENLRTTGPGSRTTLDLTHVRNSSGRMTYEIGPH